MISNMAVNEFMKNKIVILVFIIFIDLLYSFGAMAEEKPSVERLVVVYPQSFGLVYIMGLSDKVVGIPSQQLRITNGQLGPFYSKYSPNLANAKSIGYPIVNIESVLKLSPDLVISSASLPSVQDLNKFLLEHNIKILPIEGRMGSAEDWIKLVRYACDQVGASERADAYIAFWNKELEYVKSRIDKIPLENRVKVTLINANGGEITVRGSRSRFTIDLIKLAGGIVMEGEDSPTESGANAELVFKFDPDIIIDDYSKSAAAPDWIKYLRAVKNNKVYSIPADDEQAWFTNWTFNTYSPLGLLWFAKTFYPDYFKDLNIEKEHDLFTEMLLLHRE